MNKFSNLEKNLNNIESDDEIPNVLLSRNTEIFQEEKEEDKSEIYDAFSTEEERFTGDIPSRPTDLKSYPKECVFPNDEFCPIHDEAIIVKCKPHKSTLCRSCLVYGDHQKEEFEIYVPRKLLLLQLLEEEKNNIEKIRNDYTIVIEKMNEKIRILRREYEKAQNDLQELQKKLKAIIKEAIQEIQNKLERLEKICEDEEALKKGLEREKEELTNSINTISINASEIQGHTATDVKHKYPTYEKELRSNTKLYKETWRRKKQETKHNIFSFLKIEMNHNILQEFQQIKKALPTILSEYTLETSKSTKLQNPLKSSKDLQLQDPLQVSDKAAVIGYDYTLPSQLYLLSPTWEEAALMHTSEEPVPPQAFTKGGIVIQHFNTLISAGGIHSSHFTNFSKTGFLFNITNNPPQIAFLSQFNLKRKRAFFSATAYEGNAYFIGGRCANNYISEVEGFCIQKREGFKMPMLSEAKFGSSACVVQERLCVFGGKLQNDKESRVVEMLYLGPNEGVGNVKESKKKGKVSENIRQWNVIKINVDLGMFVGVAALNGEVLIFGGYGTQNRKLLSNYVFDVKKQSLYPVKSELTIPLTFYTNASVNNEKIGCFGLETAGEIVFAEYCRVTHKWDHKFLVDLLP